MNVKMLRPDSKGRITLGHLADGVSGFQVTISKNHNIILKPFSEVPSEELWLFENKTALKQVKKGLADAKAGRATKKGDFSQYLDDEID